MKIPGQKDADVINGKHKSLSLSHNLIFSSLSVEDTPCLCQTSVEEQFAAVRS